MIRILFLSMFFFLGTAGPEVKVYKGTSRYNADILCTIRDGKVYKGTSTYNSDILATLRDGSVYSGRSNYRSDIRFTIDGHLTLEEFVAVWYAVTYVC